jgi:hypothetical protein
MAGTLAFNSLKEDMQLDNAYFIVNADNATYATTAFDMTGYQGIVFIANARQQEAATWSIKARQDTASTMASAADLLNTSVNMVVGTQTNGFAFVEVQNPAETWVDCVVTVPNISTATGLCVVAIRYGKNWRPETNSDGELHYAPAEGTA